MTKQGKLFTVHNGDATEILPTLVDAGVFAVITDPPYMINIKSAHTTKLSPWADACNASVWYQRWMEQCKALLPANGCLWTCLNWRSIPTFTKALNDARWAFTSMLVWDKLCIGPGIKGLRPRYEMVGLAAMPEYGIADRTIADIQAFKWSAYKPNGHAAEKPEALMRWLIEVSTPDDAVILDPFMGSGTTGAAAIAAGRRFIGIEQDAAWFESATTRLQRAEAQLDKGVRQC